MDGNPWGWSSYFSVATNRRRPDRAIIGTWAGKQKRVVSQRLCWAEKSLTKLRVSSAVPVPVPQKIMEDHRRLDRLACGIFAAAALISGPPCAVGACNPPHYRVATVLEDDASGVAFRISIPLRDFAPERLICLAGALRQKYPGRNMTASIFSSYEAAGKFVLVEPRPKSEEYEAKYHGIYVYDKEKHEDYLRIVPDALSHEAGSPFSTRVALPVQGTPVCKLAINGRCLLEFQHITFYPSDEGGPKVSGRVAVTGNIRLNGAVSGLAVADAKANPPERRSALVSWAMHNLSTWRFEPAKHNDILRITYDFEAADAGPLGYETNAQFRLPDEVRVWTGWAH